MGAGQEGYKSTISNLLGLMNMDTGDEDYSLGESAVWERNDEVINKIQTLTIPQWCLNAEFNDFDETFDCYDWGEMLMRVLDENLPELKNLVMVDDAFPANSPIIAALGGCKCVLKKGLRRRCS
jgi:hypothetical protein